MASTRSRQRWLDLGGPAEHFRLLHGGHLANVAVCSLPRGAPRSAWQENVYAHDDAGAIAVQLTANSDLNLYQSQSGFRGGRRLASAVAAMPAAFVDLDVYNVPHLAGLDAEGLLDLVLAAHPWLPVPTLLFNSGRGVYFEWLFTKPLDREQLPRWQNVENILVALLKPFGADQQVKDAARVLRIVGSVNQKNGEIVTGVRDTGPAVPFEQLERAVMRHGFAAIATQARTAETGVPLPSSGQFETLLDRSTRSSAAQRAQFLQPLQLASDRMQDCRTIAVLRGAPLTDYRARLLFVYATSAAWYVTSVEQLEHELTGFAGEHFENGEGYGRRNVGTVLDRLQQDKDGIIGIWNGQRAPRRYRLGNPYIIGLLALSAAEQRDLRTIIGRDERQRRRVDRRRTAGMVDRRATATDRRERVVELRQRGLTQRAIAGELGITQGRVSQILSGHNY